MIFKPEMLERIRAQEKFETRRPIKGPCPYKIGRSYSAQPGRGKSGVGMLHVHDVSAQQLKDMTDDDAQCEGFETLVDFEDYWRLLYGGKWDPEQWVWVIRFYPVAGWLARVVDGPLSEVARL